MQIKKSQLETLILLTKGTEGVLGLPEARIRDAFLKPIWEVYGTFEKDKQAIYTTFCIKDEHGKPVLVGGDKYEFPPEKVEEINNELDTLFNEEVTVESNPLIKALLEKSQYKPKVGQAEIIDEILKVL